VSGNLAKAINNRQVGPRARADEDEPEVLLGGGVTISVVDPDEVVRNVLEEHVSSLQADVVGYDSVESLATAPGWHEPTVILLGPSDTSGDVIERVEALLMERSDYGAVMLVFDLSAAVVRSAFRAGIDDVVAVNGEDAELLGALSRSMARVRDQIEESERPAPMAALPVSASTGRVVTVFGTKGGTGKSVVATNLAVTLARQTSAPVVLVDANLQFGDVAIMLQLRPEHTITEAVLAGDRLDWELLQRLLLRHKPSGLLVLAAPPDPVSADEIGRSHLLGILSILRERCAWVVVDTSPRIEESTLVALQAADDIVMLTSLDVMSLKNSRLALQTLQALGIELAKVKFALNRANSEVGLSRRDAERAMEMKVDAALPSDVVVAESVNKGVPVVLGAPTSRYALCIDELARVLKAPASAPAANAAEAEAPVSAPVAPPVPAQPKVPVAAQ
jgi:pilus assembly protein CpaE